ncbi:hypothetical protein [Bradyrhizobium oligotrophicum]|uniref:hypothetical protein n=1 Tax=Bradyrhizobium oligotrophicum TaxID=44255 RepID=UPI003EB85F97
MSKNFQRGAAAWTTAVAMFTSTIEPASPQAGLAIKGLGIASTLVGMGGRGSDIDFKAIMATMRMVEAMGERLTAIEGTLSLLMKKIDALPAEVRKALDEDADRDRIERTASAISVLGNYVSAVPEARKKGAQALGKQQDLVRAAILDFPAQKGRVIPAQ